MSEAEASRTGPRGVEAPRYSASSNALAMYTAI